ncbi:MAG: S8 family serine peptidase [Bacteroidota bacterium]
MMKKKLPVLITMMMFFAVVMAQETNTYIVKLTDKANSPYKIENPEAYLSQKALERREKQGIAIEETDLPVSPAYVEQIKAEGYSITHRIKWLNTLIVEGTARENLEAFPFVKEVKKITPSKKPTEKPFFKNESESFRPESKNKGMQRDDDVYDYGEAFNQIEMLNGHLVHNEGYDGQDMTIAVLDAGFQNADEMEAFDSLWMNDRILGTANFVNDEDIFNNSISSHGTSVLSTMGGNLPGQIVGTAPQAAYWLIRTEDATDEYFMEEYYWVDGAEFADSVGADIINSSLGYTEGFNDPENNHTYEDMDGNTTPVTIGADEAGSKGILVVNSAGNSGSDSWFYIGAPADGDSVMTVGAVDGSGNYVDFSSKGPTYDGRLKPDVAAKGSSATVASVWGGVTYASGTSFSSPIMAGMTASIWQANPSLSNMELIELIREHGHQADEPDSLLGWGIPDFGAILDVIGTQNNNLTLQKAVDVYPNPFRKQITIDLPQPVDFTATLSNMAGKVILRQANQNSQETILSGISHLPGGFYFLKIEMPEGEVIRKLIKK